MVLQKKEAKGFAPSISVYHTFYNLAEFFSVAIIKMSRALYVGSLSADSIKGKKVTLKQHAKNMHSMRVDPKEA